MHGLAAKLVSLWSDIWMLCTLSTTLLQAIMHIYLVKVSTSFCTTPKFHILFAWLSGKVSSSKSLEGVVLVVHSLHNFLLPSLHIFSVIISTTLYSGPNFQLCCICVIISFLEAFRMFFYIDVVHSLHTLLQLCPYFQQNSAQVSSKFWAWAFLQSWYDFLKPSELFFAISMSCALCTTLSM